MERKINENILKITGSANIESQNWQNGDEVEIKIKGSVVKTELCDTQEEESDNKVFKVKIITAEIL
jgi:hypothetical protein